MNLLGLEIGFSKNGKYVKRDDCQNEHRLLSTDLDRRFESLKNYFDLKFDNMRDILLKR